MARPRTGVHRLVAQHPPHRLRFSWLAIPVLLGWLSGCAGWADPFATGWMADYDRVERERADSGRPVIFFFKDHRRERNKPVREALEDARVQRLIAPRLKCTLACEYEPDRRYARQFGVERAPALILLD